ncbi:pimeloyl-ACP methyl ester carboxylesterase [Kribbella amoyensis]|uniref:Pimeloyl-ACP methyl ester carboxylesterase n=1 Tax=Kribbella amoyensis TaxID=996641 RepID=A0A561BPT2_9ACTN|nr:alpha/beta hydrolase [Kribbella amoyensis]TWD80813.1 pimeloyl-ACP methyl ester carboxylesterase [Kribbella amoyensis]
MDFKVPGGVVWGEDSGGDGLPLVFLHSGAGDSRGWDAVVHRLPQRVIRYDVRGYGRSPRPTTPFTMQGDLAAVLEYCGVERAVLVGCSLGGSTAICQALVDPQSVAGLVLLCPGLTGYPWPDEPELDKVYDELAAAGDVEGLVRFGLDLWAAAGSDGEVAEQVRAAVPGWLAQSDFRRPDVAAYGRLGEIRVPTAVLVGDRDRPILAACAGAIAARIEGSRLVWAPGVDHFPALRAPDLVARTILDVIAETTDAGAPAPSHEGRA